MNKYNTFLLTIIIVTILTNLSSAYYQYETGRWLNQDPIGYQDSINLYAYVGSNPVNSLDSYGLFYCEADCPEEPESPWQGEGGWQIEDDRCALEYIQYGWLHTGILIYGEDFDFGPAGGKPIPIWDGECPWSGNPGINENSNFVWKKWLTIRESGIMEHSWAGPLLCKFATCGDIYECLNKECEKWDKKTWTIIYPNCRSFVDESKSKCCLE